MYILLVSKIVGILALISIAIIIIYAGHKLFGISRSPFISFLQKYGYGFAFTIALVAMLMSLFYSDVANFGPCVLCWYQRIFMYPIVFLLGFAHLRAEKHLIAFYGIVLASIGAVISVYHNVLYYGESYGVQSIIPCSSIGLGPSCTTKYVEEFGFITIPLMALITFLLIIISLSAYRSSKHS